MPGILCAAGTRSAPAQDRGQGPLADAAFACVPTVVASEAFASLTVRTFWRCRGLGRSSWRTPPARSSGQQRGWWPGCGRPPTPCRVACGVAGGSTGIARSGQRAGSGSVTLAPRPSVPRFGEFAPVAASLRTAETHKGAWRTSAQRTLSSGASCTLCVRAPGVASGPLLSHISRLRMWAGGWQVRLMLRPPQHAGDDKMASTQALAKDMVGR